MGSIFKYSGLTTKVRAMRAGLINFEQYKKISKLTTVREMVEFLKMTKGYADIFKDIDPSDMHRGHMEKLMLCSKYRDYEKIYRFANMEQRRYMSIHFLKYEIDILKQAIVYAINPEHAEPLNGVDEIIGKYSRLDIKAVCEAENIRDILEATKGSIFYDTLLVVSRYPKPTEFDYEIALDLFLFSYVWKRRKKLFKDDELKSISMSIGTEADTLNIMWIHRAKRYYDLSSEQIYAMIIPVYYKLRKEHIKGMVEAEDENAFFEALSNNYYGKYVDKETFKQGKAGKVFEAYAIRYYQKLFKLDPYSLSAINAYLKDKEVEIKRLITMAECIRYQYPLKDFMSEVN